MERASKAKILITILSAALYASSVSAGTILMPPPAPNEQDEVNANGERYPDSRFGTRPGEVGGPAIAQVEEPRDLGGYLGNVPRAGRRGPASLLEQSSGGQMGETTPAPRTILPTSRDDLARPSEVEAMAARRNGVQEVALIAGDLGYFPKTVFVTRDIPVRMFVTGASRSTLCLMLDSFQVRKQVRSQKIEEITFTPNTPGQYRFYCPVNGMEGTLIVKELAGL